MIVVHVATVASTMMIVLVLLRTVKQQSPLIGRIVEVALLVRALAGLVLFTVSYMRWPVFRSLQLDPGFWSVAIDASGYYHAATGLLDEGLSIAALANVEASYVSVLAAWMWLVGVSPIAGPLLNLLLFAVISALLVRAYQPSGRTSDDMPLVIAMIGISFSPALVLNSTQALKDDLFLFALIATIVSTLALMRVLEHRPSAPRLAGPSLGIIAGCVLGGSLRYYHPPLVAVALAASALVFVLKLSADSVRRRVFLGAVAIVVVGVAYTGRATALAVADSARSAFVLSGGGTNLVTDAASDPSVDTPEMTVDGLRAELFAAAGSDPRRLAALNDPVVLQRRLNRRALRLAQWREAQASIDLARLPALLAAPHRGAAFDSSGVRTRPSVLATGIAAMVVPMSLLKALGFVSFAGGRGLLPVADVDTLFMDGLLMAMAVAAYRSRSRLQTRTYVVFGVVLAATTMMLMAYVVTNFGTMFRMRFMATLPFLMVALAYGRPRWTASGA